jgi:serine/threonine-protein kinase
VDSERRLAWDGANTYQSICELGKGGMASVSLALLSGKAGFQKLVALKRPAGDLLQEPELLTMFLDEARLAARLNHPNVVQTHEVGLHGGRPFIAMEFVDGQPLSRIRILPGLPLSLHLCILADVLLGLHHAHELRDFDGAELRVVHRDVSPQNVLVSYDGLAKLVDFGIAKAHTQLTQTRAGYVKGKLAYMSPEQILGDDLDRRADLFAVGVLLWEACAQQRLWPAVSTRERVRLLQAGDVPSLTRHNPRLPAALDQLCRRALAFSPDQRYQTAAELEIDLQHVLAGSALHATRRDVAAFMGRHFQAQQAETRTLIETKLGHSNSEAMPARAACHAGPSGGRLGAGTLLLFPPPAPNPPESRPTSSLLPPPPSRSHGPASAPPRNSVHSWGRSAPPPPPCSRPHEPRLRSWFFAAPAALIVGGGLLALHATLAPVALPFGASPAGSAPSPAASDERRPLPPLQAATAASLAGTVQGIPAADPSRAGEPASGSPTRRTPTRATKPTPTTVGVSRSGPGASPAASFVPVTDFGGRR